MLKEFLPNCCGGIKWSETEKKSKTAIVVGFLELGSTSRIIWFLVGNPYERVGGWVKWWCSQNPAAKTSLTSIFDVDNVENLVALGLSFKRVDNYNTTLPSWKLGFVGAVTHFDFVNSPKPRNMFLVLEHKLKYEFSISWVFWTSAYVGIPLNQAGFYQIGPCFFLGSRVGSNDGVQCIAPLWLRPSKRKRSLIPARRHTKNTWKRDMIGFNIAKFLGYTLHPVKVVNNLYIHF